MLQKYKIYKYEIYFIFIKYKNVANLSKNKNSNKPC